MLWRILKPVLLLLFLARSELVLATRADTWRITVGVNGVHTGVWDVKEGGDVDSNELTYKPGGMVDPISLGGTRNVNNVTLRRNYRLGRDHAVSQRWINWVGKGKVTINQQPLDEDGNSWGKPITYKGTLKRCKLPDVDSQSSDAAMIEIEITVAGIPTGQSGTVAG
jgi:hypothetical protein